MTPLAASFLLVQLIAVAWSVVYWRRLRDWRFGLLTLMLSLMAVRRMLTLAHDTGRIALPDSMIEAMFMLVSVAGVAAVVGLGRLVSERDLALGALRRERDLSESIINSLPGVFYLYDESLTFQRWNRNFERVTGYDAEEMKRRQPLDFFVGEQRNLLAGKIEQVFRTGAGEVEADFVCKDGRRIPYYFNGARVELDGRPCLIGMGIDITARKEVERQLELHAQRLSLAVEGAALGTWHWNPPDGAIWSGRRAVMRSSGCHPTST